MPWIKERFRALQLAGMAVLIGLIIAGAWIYYLREHDDVEQKARNELIAIADLKADEITNWRNERLGDGRFFARAPFVARDIQRLLANPDDPAIRAEILTWLDLLKAGDRYELVALFSANQSLLLSLPERGARPGTIMLDQIAATLATNQVAISDLHRGTSFTNVHLDVTFPVFPLGLDGRIQTNDPPLAAILLRLEPRQFLYPLLNLQTTPRPSAETVLVRREGDRVLYLNQLRCDTNTALALSLPLGEPDLPAAMALRAGKPGVYEGKDYRGRHALGAFRPIPDSTWWLGVKMDSEEFMAPARAEAVRITMAALVLVLCVVGGAGWFFKQRSLEHAEEQLALANRIAFLTRHANDIILLADEQLRIIDCNERALLAYGYTAEEMRRLTVRDIRLPGTEAALQADVQRVNREGGGVYEVLQRRKDGSIFPVETSVRVIQLEGRRIYQAINRDITERKRAEEQLRASETRFRAYTDQAADAVFVHDEDGRLVDVNRQACASLGYTREELLAMNVLDVELNQDPDEARRIWKQVCPGKRARLQGSHRRKDGTRFPVEVSFGCFEFQGQKLLMGMARDITERQRTEAALRDSEELYHALVEQLPQALFRLDRSGRVTFANSRYCEVLGLRLENLLGKTDFDLFPSAVAERYWADSRRVMETGEPFETVEEHLTADGGITYAQVLKSALRDRTGQITGLQCLFWDVTARQKAEQQLREGEERLRTLGDNIPGGALYQLVVDRDGRSRYSYMSAGIEKIFGFTAEDVVANPQPFWDCILEQDRSLVSEAQLVSARDLTIFDQDFRQRTVAGDVRWVHARSSPRRLEDGSTVWDGVVADVTARAQAEEALRESEARLQAVLEGSQLGYWDWNIATGEVQRNARWAEMLGYTLEEIQFTVKQWTDLIHPEDRATAARSLQDHLTGRAPFHEAEYRMRTKDGGYKWILDRAQIVRWDAQQRPLRMSGTHTDVTERKQAEVERETLARQRQLALNAARLGWWHYDPQAQIASFDDRYREIFGVTGEQRDNREILKLLHPEDLPRVLAAVQAALNPEAPQPYAAEYRVRRPDGAVRWVEAHGVAEFEGEGQDRRAVSLVGTVEDITDRKQSEQMLRENEERLRLALRAASQGLYDLNVQTGEAIVSPEYASMLGYDPATFRETNAAWRERLHPDDVGKTYQVYQEYIAGTISDYRVEFRQRTKSGTWKWILSVGRLVAWDSQGVPLRMLGTHTDITDRKLAEEALRLSEERLRLAAEAAHMGTWDRDVKTNQLFWSAEQERLMGYEPGTFPGTGEAFVDLLHPDCLEAHAAAQQRARTGDGYFQAELHFLRKDGRDRWGFLRGRTYFDAEGKPERIIGVDIDITERKRAAARAAALSALGLKLSAVREPAQAAQAIADIGLQLFSWDAFFLDLYDRRTDVLTQLLNMDTVGGERVHVQRPLPKNQPTPLMRGVLLGKGQLLLRGESDCILTTVRFGDVERQSMSLMFVPIRHQGASIGILSMQSYRARFYTPQDLEALQGLADHCAGALLRLQAEAALRQSEERLRLAQESAKAGSWEWNLATNENVWSPELWRLYRLDPERYSASYESWRLTVHPDELPRMEELVQQAARTGTEINIEYRMPPCAEPERWLLSRGQPFRNAQGEVERYVGIVMDITAIKRAEAQLRESEGRYRALVEHAPVAVFVNREDRITLVNQACLRLFGADSPEQLLGKSPFELFDPSFHEIMRGRIRVLREQGGVVPQLEERIVRLDGTPVDVDVTAAPFEDQGIRALHVVLQDITDRKRSEALLRHRNAMLDEMGRMAKVGGWEFDLKKGTLEWTREVYAIHEVGDDFQPTVESAINFYTPEARPVIQEAVERAIREGVSFDLELELITARGNRIWVHAVGHARSEAGQVRAIAGTFQEITARKKAEDEIRQLNQTLEQRVVERTAQLQAANKELEGFSYSVSHDLRAPLRAIDGFAGILAEEYQQQIGEEGRRMLGIVCGEARRMGQLIDDLLAFSRMNRLPVRSMPTEMDNLARTVFQECVAHEPGRTIELEMSPLPPANGDPILLRQVLVNLFSNAVKYTRPRAVARIQAGAVVEEGEYRFSIKDNGVGFDMRYAGKLFGVFQRLHTEDEFEGTGVGLAIVQRVIHRHGGRVWAEGKVDEGAAFHFTLPDKPSAL